MIDQFFPQTLLLLGTVVTVIVVFQRLRIPSSLGYLLVGVLLGPHTIGPTLAVRPIRGNTAGTGAWASPCPCSRMSRPCLSW